MRYWTDYLSRLAGGRAPRLRAEKVVGVYLKIATFFPFCSWNVHSWPKSGDPLTLYHAKRQTLLLTRILRLRLVPFKHLTRRPRALPAPRGLPLQRSSSRSLRRPSSSSLNLYTSTTSSA